MSGAPGTAHVQGGVGPPAGATAPRAAPSRLTIAIIVVALIGVGLATYLTVIHYAGIKPICDATQGCEKVQSSVYSKVAGVPVALLGLIGYIVILGSLAIRSEAGRMATAAIAIAGFGFSVYLTYREVFTIKAICWWCVGSAALMTVLAVLATMRLLRGEPGSTLTPTTPD